MMERMRIEEDRPLAALTTLRVGGAARLAVTCESDEDILTALAFAAKENLPWTVLGQGSNILASDEGFAGVVLLMRSTHYEFKEEDDRVLLVADAGASWDALVSESVSRGLWGLENLAGIPGTVGAAPVQNIGAYGAELGDTLAWVEVIDVRTREMSRLPAAACGLGYRDSRFKREPELVIVRVAVLLSKHGEPRTSYKDLVARSEAGEDLSTPKAIASAVRTVRSVKFPDLREYGTAGSFFKNPVVSPSAYEALQAQYPDLPCFETPLGIKIPLAWILDHVLQLRSFALGPVHLFERQPLVLVTDTGATAHDVELLANEVTVRVKDATGILIEREVRSLPQK